MKNSRKEKISVLIPSYQVEPFISRCLDSVISQTYPNLEILVVDDGSSDGTVDVLRSYAANDDRIRVWQEVHRGVSIVRNQLLKEA